MKKRFCIFISICFGLSLVSAGLFHFLGGNYQSIPGTLFASGYMFIPMISVLFTQMILGEKAFSSCGFSFRINRWWFVAWAGFLVLPVLAALASVMMPGVGISLETEYLQKSMDSFAAQGLTTGPWGILGITCGSGLLAGATINTLFALGEETAWRGYLANCLDSLGFWKKSLVIGLIWGVWHAPLILMGHNYPSNPVAGVAMMTALCILLTPIMMFLRERAGSVMAAAIAHGTMNAIAGIALMLLTGYNEFLCGMTGLAGFIIMAVADILILVAGKKSIL